MKNNAPSKPIGEQSSPLAAENLSITPRERAMVLRIISEQAQRPPNEGFITKQELAPLLRKTPRTLENYLRQGLLPSIRIGRSVLFSWPDVQAALRESFTINAKGAK